MNLHNADTEVKSSGTILKCDYLGTWCILSQSKEQVETCGMLQVICNFNDDFFFIFGGFVIVIVTPAEPVEPNQTGQHRAHQQQSRTANTNRRSGDA
jgi:hypothetical protein